MKFGRMQVGLAVTGLYALGLGILVVVRWPELRCLGLNELGDFAAGIAGPIAFLWLVLGYFQQGDELALNTKALHDQAEELRSSVRAQEELAAATREQNQISMQHQKESLLRLKRLAQPVFDIDVLRAIGDPFDRLDLAISATNLGNECTNLQFSWHCGDLNRGSDYIGTLPKGGSERFEVSLRGQEDSLSIECYFNYSDAEGEPQSQSMTMECKWDETHNTYLTMFQHPRWDPHA